MSAPARRPRPVEVLRDLPAHIEAEKSFLGSVFIKDSILDQEILTPDDFYLDSHKKIYETMLDLWEERVPIDPVTLSDRLEKKGWDGLTGGFPYLEDLSYIVPTGGNASHYARILKRKTALRKSKILNAQHAQAIEDGDLEAVERIERKMAEREETEHSDTSIDAAALSPVHHRAHIVKDWIPRGIAIALHGPPGTGKSVFLTKMTISVASGKPFYGLETASGRVMYVSNEWADNDEISRIWYEKTRGLAQGRLALEPSRTLLEWVSTEKDGHRKSEWGFTAQGRKILRKIEKMRPDLIIFDTVLGLCSGVEQLNNAMTYALGDLLQKQIATKFNAALILVAHTNQASGKETLQRRLHYEAMAGGNGLPGALLMSIGLTKVQTSDFGKNVEALNRLKQGLVAVGSSKFNIQGFKPLWTDSRPGFFSWGHSGLELDSNPFCDEQMTKKKDSVVTVTEQKGGDDDNFLPF